MAAQPEDPIVLRRRLRTELRTLRRDRGLTQAQAAEALDWSPSKILRIESGDVRVAPSDVRLLALQYEVTDKRRVDQLVEMARLARSDPYAAYKDIHRSASIEFFGYEAASIRIREYNMSWVPGLLQTEEYALTLLEQAFGDDKKQSEHRWQARAQRQTVFERSELPEMFFLLDEGVVRRDVGGPTIMRRQLEHVVELAQNRRINVRVLPFHAGAHPGLQGSFTLLEFADPRDDDVLYLEHIEEFIRDDPAQTSRFLERFFELEAVALSRDDTRGLLERRVADLAGKTAEPVTDRAEVES